MEDSESDEFEPSQLAYQLKNRPNLITPSRGPGQISVSLKSSKTMAQPGPQIIGSKFCQVTSPTTPTTSNQKGITSDKAPLKNLNTTALSHNKKSVITGQSSGSKTSDSVSNTNNLIVHDVRQMPSSSKSLVCSHCDKYFADPVVLTEHLYKVIKENAGKENERLSDDEETSDEDMASLNEEVVEKSPRFEELEGLPPVKISTPKGNTQNMFTIKYLCTECNILIKSKYHCSKHRGQCHPKKKHKTLFKTISVPVEDRNSKVKLVPVVTVEGLNRIIVPDNNLKKTASSPQRSQGFKALSRDQTFLNKPKANQYTKQHSTQGNYQDEMSNVKQNTNHSNLTFYMCVKCMKVVDKNGRDEHWRTQHPSLGKSKKAFVSVNIPVCEKTEKTEKVTQKTVEVSRKRKANENPKDQTKQRRMSQEGPERVTERQGNNDNASNETDTDVQSIYQCGRCLLHFISLNTLSVHFEVCESQTLNAMKCGKCGLSFSSEELIAHIYRDHIFERRLDFNILQVLPHISQSSHSNSTSKEDRRKVDLYECSVCGLHFVNEHSLRSHFRHKVHNQPRHSCKICYYTFCQTSLNHHEVLHHDEMGLTRQDFNVIPKNFESNAKTNHTTFETSTEKAPTAKRKDTTLLSDSEESDTSISDDGNEADSDMEEEWTPSQEGKDLPPAMKLPRFIKRKLKNNMHKCKKCSKIYFTKSKQHDSTCLKCKDTVTYISQQRQDDSVTVNGSDLTRPGQERGADCNPNDKCHIFKCAVCSIHFTASSTLNKHLSIEAHDAEIRINCPICKLVFSAESLSRHTKRHHKELHLTIEDYKIISRNAPVNRGSAGVTRPIENGKAENQVQLSTSHERRNVEEHKTLYKCTICNIHFIERGTWRSHFANKSHRPKTNTKCTICHLTFSKKSMRKHIKLHHTLFKLKREDFVIIKNTRKTHHKAKNVSQNGEERTEQGDESGTKLPQNITDTVNPDACENVIYRCEECAQKVSRNGEKRTEQSEESSTKLPQNQNISKATDTVNPDACENIIYRCEECDVYFIKEYICLQHCREHLALSRLDYLNCPECNLQFENDSIGAHRKKHHSKDNNLQAVVKTYQPHTRMVNKDNDICCVMLVQPNKEIVRPDPDTVELVTNRPNQLVTWNMIRVIDKTIQEVEMQNAENIQLHIVSNIGNEDTSTRAANKINANELCTILNMHQNCHVSMNTTEIQNRQSPQMVSESVIDDNIQTSMGIQSAENNVIGFPIETNDKSVSEVTKDIVRGSPRIIIQPTSLRSDANITETQSQQSSHDDPEITDSITIETTVEESRETSDMTNFAIPSTSTFEVENIFVTISNHGDLEEVSQHQTTINEFETTIPISEEDKEEPSDFTSPNVKEIKLSQNMDEMENKADHDHDYFKENNIKVSYKSKDDVKNTDCAENIEEEIVHKTEDVKIDDEDTMCWWNSQVEIVSVSEDETITLTQFETKRQLMKGDDNGDGDDVSEVEHGSNISNAKPDEANIAPVSEKVDVLTEVNDCVAKLINTIEHDGYQPATDDEIIIQSLENPNGTPMEVQTDKDYSNISLCIDGTIEMNNEFTLTNNLQDVNNCEDNVLTSYASAEMRDKSDDTTERDAIRKVDHNHNREKRSQTPKQCDTLSISHEPDPVTHSDNNNPTVIKDRRIDFRNTTNMNSDASQKISMEHYAENGTINKPGLNKILPATDESKETNKDDARYELNRKDDLDCGQEDDNIVGNDVQLTNQVADCNVTEFKNIDKNAKLQIGNISKDNKNHCTEQSVVKLSEPSNQSKNIVMEICKVAKIVFQPIENTGACNGETPLKQTLTIQNPLANLPGDLDAETHNNNLYFDTPCSDNANKVSQNKHKNLDGDKNLNKENNPMSAKGVSEQERDSNESAKQVSTEICAQTSEDNQNPFMVYIPDRLLGEIQDRDSFLTITEELTGDLKVETIEDDHEQETVDNVNDTMATATSKEFDQSREINEKSDDSDKIQSKETKESDSNLVESANISFENIIHNTIPQRDDSKKNEASKPEKSDNHSVSRCPKIPLNSIIKEEGVQIIDDGIEYIDYDEDDDVIFVSTSTEQMNVITVDDSDDDADRTRSGRKNTYANIKIPQPIILHVSDDESTNGDVTVKREKYEQSDIRKYFKH